MSLFTPSERQKIAEVARIRREARKAATKARPKSPKATRGREIDNGFRQYIRRQPCEAAHLGGCEGRIEHAHVSYHQDGIPNSFGRGVKNHDRHGNPLCTAHHALQSRIGEKPLWALIGKDAYETAAAHYAEYQSPSLRQPARRGS